jgi:hypothetical protein
VVVRVSVAPSLLAWASERSGRGRDDLERRFPKLLAAPWKLRLGGRWGPHFRTEAATQGYGGSVGQGFGERTGAAFLQALVELYDKEAPVAEYQRAYARLLDGSATPRLDDHESKVIDLRFEVDDQLAAEMLRRERQARAER